MITELKKLKTNILENKNIALTSFMIFKYEDNLFLVQQYLNAISEKLNKPINKISSLQDLKSSATSLIMNYTDYINVLEVEEFNELCTDAYSSFTSCIVICKKINESILSFVKDFVIDFPKLTDWQVKDYLKMKNQNLTDDIINFLYLSTSGNLYRLENEISKLNLLTLDEINEWFSGIKYDPYTDLFQISIFDLINAIIKHDIFIIGNYLLHKKTSEIDPFALISLLISNLKKILFVCFQSGLNCEQIGITNKQYYGIKSGNIGISEKYIKNALLFLTSIDEKIKSGKLELEKEELIDYVICNILNCY